ncbi:hypothetical protein BDF14DRAFT_1782735 [Spinellus fusiger]|nr:hypothetical protein BDF14DRAFT_1782735 [Spinellus fusiger]
MDPHVRPLQQRHRGRISSRVHHPLQATLSSLPHIVISGAIVFVTTKHTKEATVRDLSIGWFLLGSIGFLCVCSLFVYLQLRQADYQDWRRNPTTSKAIEIASMGFIVTLFGYHCALWPVYHWFTPLVVVSGLLLASTGLHIATAWAMHGQCMGRNRP